MALSSALIGDVAGEREPVRYQHVPDDGVAAALGLEGIELAADPEPTSDAEAVRRNWADGLARARRIEVGEWLATADASGRPQILSVAFLGDDFSSFVLVDRKGVKVRECTLAEITEDICLGRVTPLDDFDLPLMERASQRMLESMHSRLAFQASHDELTTLMNRREFERLVERSVQMAHTRDEIHALLYIDLDQFKIINNTSGHTAGDELLKRIAAWLSGRFVSDRVHVARLGGDEFGILAESVTVEQARELAAEVLKFIREHVFEWEGRTYNLSATIGLVLIDSAIESVDHAMRHADEACYAAKDAGRNRVQEYRAADTIIRARQGIMESVTQLDRALVEDRLVLNCQPIAPIDTGSGRRMHYEILLSMIDGSGQVIPPAEFILAAEKYQRMAAVDRWVISRVLRWMVEHRDRLEGIGGFAVNVSGDSMNDETFPDFVLQQFEETGAPTSKVCFEITETAAIANLDNAREFMNRMKIIGCSFSLDDFGTGHSSYSYLRNLPVDFVKVDGVFIRSLAESADDYAVVRSINEIGHYLGKETIAECVESHAILDRIGEMGMDYAQGFFVGRPLRLEELQL
jgi:diguanylate cyclase (GGDEF)-like protein